MIATGELGVGSQMPPVRDLASELLINPNTVAKAYHDLEREGYISTRRGMGTFVNERETRVVQDRERAHAEELTREFVTRLHELGLSAEEIRSTLEDVLASSPE